MGAGNDEQKYSEFLRAELEKRYKPTTLKGQQAFIRGDSAFLLTFFPDFQAFALEYSDNMEQARKGIYPEDGSWFYIADMSKEDMLSAMVQEIGS